MIPNITDLNLICKQRRLKFDALHLYFSGFCTSPEILVLLEVSLILFIRIHIWVMLFSVCLWPYSAIWRIQVHFYTHVDGFGDGNASGSRIFACRRNFIHEQGKQGQICPLQRF